MNKFCDYYKISRKRLKKNEIIKQLILFETNEDNIELVERRRTLWEYFLILKEDPFFKKFIICEKTSAFTKLITSFNMIVV